MFKPLALLWYSVYYDHMYVQVRIVLAVGTYVFVAFPITKSLNI